ncbi:MAG: lactonase family protein [Oscillospiraceae bacterium]|nr:lactonase family protein [Oscillospiraceae bacterium]
MRYNFYVACADEIRYYKGAELIDSIKISCPMYMELYNNKMYIVARFPFADSKESGMTYCGINADGSFGQLSEIVSTQGEAGCHITVDGDDVYAANYATGSLIKYGRDGVKFVQHKGSGPIKDRQQGAHVHQVIFTPDKEYLCAVDLGIDAIRIYDRELNFRSQGILPAGSGPRHIVFSHCKNIAYCVNELGNSVTKLQLSEDFLYALDTVSILPADYTDGGTAAAIRISPDDKFIYASNRGHNSIACCTNEMKVIDIVQCGGKWPRDFNLTSDGKFLYCANERSDDITIFERDEATGRITQVDRMDGLPAPVCVVFR